MAIPVGAETRQCRAPDRAPVKATRYAGGGDADLDRRVRRARAYASAPEGMPPVSHRGEWTDMVC